MIQESTKKHQKGKASKKAYTNDSGKYKEAPKKAYANDPDKKRTASKKAYKETTEKRKQGFKEDYYEHREEVYSKQREETRYVHPMKAW